MAMVDADEFIRQEALADLGSWLRLESASASRGDLATRRRLSKRLDAVEHLLGDHAVTQLRFHAALRPQDLAG